MLKSVLELHEQRVAAYRELDAAFRQFLLDEQEKIFGLATARATQEFVRISTAILEVQKNADGEAADLIKRLQAEEQKKLALTVRLQTLQKAHFIDAVRADKQEEAIMAAERAGTNIVGHVHDPHQGPIVTLADKRQPPADALYDREAGATARELAACIEDINDVVAEIREQLSEQSGA